MARCDLDLNWPRWIEHVGLHRHFGSQLSLRNLLATSKRLRYWGAISDPEWRALERHSKDRLTRRRPPVRVPSENLISDCAREGGMVGCIQVCRSIRIVRYPVAIPIDRPVACGERSERASAIVEAKEIRRARTKACGLIELTILGQGSGRVTACRQHLIGIVQAQANATETEAFAAGAGRG